jgi:glutaredoxin
MRRSWLFAAVAGLAVATPAWALYKVVAPDGTVTYTDRPPAAASVRVAPLRAGEPAPAAALPADLAAVARRFPVTLVVAADCAPCDEARTWLRARGVPYAERSVSSEADTAALRRLSGATDLPVAMIGRQVVRGFQEQEWAGYLDAAGYPRTSRLPPGYRFEAAAALAPAPATAAVSPAAAPPPGPVAEPSPGGTVIPGFRF